MPLHDCSSIFGPIFHARDRAGGERKVPHQIRYDDVRGQSACGGQLEAGSLRGTEARARLALVTDFRRFMRSRPR